MIRCGGIYKAVEPGQTFECAIDVKQQAPKPQAADPKNQAAKLKTVAIKPSQPDAIRVTIDPENNINWQRVTPGVASLASSKSPANKVLGQPGWLTNLSAIVYPPCTESAG